MSETSTMEPPATDAHTAKALAEGNGKHRENGEICSATGQKPANKHSGNRSRWDNAGDRRQGSG